MRIYLKGKVILKFYKTDSFFVPRKSQKADRKQKTRRAGNVSQGQTTENEDQDKSMKETWKLSIRHVRYESKMVHPELQ